mmetsp:Transcript_10301/g.34113  ORF Transcript_10301/g.34113 Transcript_10301/m.34113 type:complete len:460 (-) Transcript_10301:939-2318(-)
MGAHHVRVPRPCDRLRRPPRARLAVRHSCPRHAIHGVGVSIVAGPTAAAARHPCGRRLRRPLVGDGGRLPRRWRAADGRLEPPVARAGGGVLDAGRRGAWLGGRRHVWRRAAAVPRRHCVCVRPARAADRRGRPVGLRTDGVALAAARRGAFVERGPHFRLRAAAPRRPLLRHGAHRRRRVARLHVRRWQLCDGLRRPACARHQLAVEQARARGERRRRRRRRRGQRPRRGAAGCVRGRGDGFERRHAAAVRRLLFGGSDARLVCVGVRGRRSCGGCFAARARVRGEALERRERAAAASTHAAAAVVPVRLSRAGVCAGGAGGPHARLHRAAGRGGTRGRRRRAGGRRGRGERDVARAGALHDAAATRGAPAAVAQPRRRDDLAALAGACLGVGPALPLHADGRGHAACLLSALDRAARPREWPQRRRLDCGARGGGGRAQHARVGERKGGRASRLGRG